MEVEPGTIEVKTTGDSRIAVDVLRKVEWSSKCQGGGDPEPARGQLRQQGNDLMIRAKMPSGFLRWRRSGLQVRYVVSIPTEFNVDLKNIRRGYPR